MNKVVPFLVCLAGASTAPWAGKNESELAALDAQLGGCGWRRCVNCTGGPCSPSNQKCIGNPPKYTFHLADPTCDINDPNGPFYDPVHGIYHNFYQIHLAEDMDGAGDGPDWGHWVSRDFVKWAQLPVAIWNDKWYDNSAIYTGSTTIVDGKPVIMYPGKCKGNLGCNGGKGGFTYVLVVPKNESDPLYTEWTKTGEVSGKKFSNPILNSTGDDPSTAWKTAHGEWRVIGNQGCSPEGGNPIYGSMDFVNWYKVGCTTLMAGDCPTFFPLPKLTPGSEHYVEAHGTLPNYVHKSGGKGGDQVQVGTWTDGTPGPEGKGTPGVWALTPGSASVLQDNGHSHASKDFWDPVKKRRILWIWGQVPSGIQAIPREMTYHPGLKQVVYSPVEEMMQLRSGQIAKLDTMSLKPATSASLKVAEAADLEVVFDLPSEATTLEVAIGGGSVFLKYVPPTGTGKYTVQVGFGNADKDSSFGNNADTLPLLPDDKQLSFRIFLDGTVAEAYWQNGRVAMTLEAKPSKTVSIQSSAASVQLVHAASYSMSSIYTSTENVLATPRSDYTRDTVAIAV